MYIRLGEIMNLNELLMERLNILEENHVICKEAASFSKIAWCVFWLKYRFGRIKAVMFITHLAMAVQRILSGEMRLRWTVRC